MNVSPGSIEDVSRVAALYRATFDDRLSTVTGIRHRQTSARPDDALRFWRAEEHGELIGWAFAGLDSFASLRTTANASIVVHPAHRRAGAGSALWDERPRISMQSEPGGSSPTAERTTTALR